MVYIQCLRCEKWFDSIGERKYCDECRVIVDKKKSEKKKVKPQKNKVRVDKKFKERLEELSPSFDRREYQNHWDKFVQMKKDKKDFYQRLSPEKIDPEGIFCPKCNKKRPPSYFPSGNKEKICTYCHYLKRRYGYNWYDKKYYPKE